MKENFEKIFNEAANNKKYYWGVQKFESLLKNYPELKKNDLFMSRFGLMYDHLALMRPGKNYRKKAFKIYKAMLKINPRSYRATWGLGRILWHKKDKKALGYILKAYKLAKLAKAPLGLYSQNIGAIYEMIKDFKNAEKWYKKGIKIEPKEWGVYLNIINFYTRNNKIKKAKIYIPKLEKLLKKNESKKFLLTKWGQTVLDIINNFKKNKGAV